MEAFTLACGRCQDREILMRSLSRRGGGASYGGTGFTCLKCNADESRAYMDAKQDRLREDEHQKAGDAIGMSSNPFSLCTSSWGCTGIQWRCATATAKPAQDDLIQIVPAGWLARLPKASPRAPRATHLTEYGPICSTSAHSATLTRPSPRCISENRRPHIPVSNGDFAMTLNDPGPPTSHTL